MHCQKQSGNKDCGVFSIGFATTIVLGLNPQVFVTCNESTPSGLL